MLHKLAEAAKLYLHDRKWVEKPEWTTEDEERFRSFLKTDTGKKLKAYLLNLTLTYNAEAVQAENNLEISISDFKKIVGRDPKINWFESVSDIGVSSIYYGWESIKCHSTNPHRVSSGILQPATPCLDINRYCCFSFHSRCGASSYNSDKKGIWVCRRE